jgi:hypothetical protein
MIHNNIETSENNFTDTVTTDPAEGRTSRNYGNAKKHMKNLFILPQISTDNGGWDILLTEYGIMRHILSNSMHLTGAGDNYTRRASGMGVDCIDGLSQYRTQTQSSYRIHPCPSDFYLWLKKNCRDFNKTGI